MKHLESESRITPERLFEEIKRQRDNLSLLSSSKFRNEKSALAMLFLYKIGSAVYHLEGNDSALRELYSNFDLDWKRIYQNNMGLENELFIATDYKINIKKLTKSQYAIFKKVRESLGWTTNNLRDITKKLKNEKVTPLKIEIIRTIHDFNSLRNAYGQEYSFE